MYIIYYSYGFIFRKNVDLIYSTKLVEKDPLINFTYIKIDLAFGIQRQGDGGNIFMKMKVF